MDFRSVCQLIILEANEDKAALLKKRYPALTDDAIQNIIDCDPTQAKNYVVWLGRQVHKGDITLPDDREEISRALGEFDDAKRRNLLRGDQADIMRLRSSGDLHTLVDEVGGRKTKGERIRASGERGQEIVLDEPPWKVVRITTSVAAARLCRNTVWCIKDPDFSREYLVQGPLLLVYRHDEPFALVHEPTGEVKDPRNAPLGKHATDTLRPVIDKLPIGKMIGQMKPFKTQTISRDVADIVVSGKPSLAFAYAMRRKGRVPEVEDVIAKSPVAAMDYVTKHWQHISVFADDMTSDSAWFFGNKSNKSNKPSWMRWPNVLPPEEQPSENFLRGLAKTPKGAIAAMAMTGKMTPEILFTVSEHPVTATVCALRTGRRIEQAEPVIMEDDRCAIVYYMHFFYDSGKPWDEWIRHLARHPDKAILVLSSLDAWETHGKRGMTALRDIRSNEAIVSGISRDPKQSLVYANEVIRGRFEKGEELILSRFDQVANNLPGKITYKSANDLMVELTDSITYITAYAKNQMHRLSGFISKVFAWLKTNEALHGAVGPWGLGRFVTSVATSLLFYYTVRIAPKRWPEFEDAMSGLANKKESSLFMSRYHGIQEAMSKVKDSKRAVSLVLKNIRGIYHSMNRQGMSQLSPEVRSGIDRSNDPWLIVLFSCLGVTFAHDSCEIAQRDPDAAYRLWKHMLIAEYGGIPVHGNEPMSIFNMSTSFYWMKHEEKIARHPMWAAEYHMSHPIMSSRRWPEAEAAMRSDPKAWEIYTATLRGKGIHLDDVKDDGDKKTGEIKAHYASTKAAIDAYHALRASNKVSGRMPEFEPYIAKRPQEIVCYTAEVKERIPEMERVLLKKGTLFPLFTYTNMLMRESLLGSRWPEWEKAAEKRMQAATDAEVSKVMDKHYGVHEYIEKFVTGPWPAYADFLVRAAKLMVSVRVETRKTPHVYALGAIALYIGAAGIKSWPEMEAVFEAGSPRWHGELQRLIQRASNEA